MLSEVLILFFVIAVVYSSVGFGGGSSYLAVLALWSIPIATLRPAALLCNLIVVSGNLLIFWKNNLIDFRRSARLVFPGIPMAFLGGYWKLSDRTLFLTLGFSLMAAAVAMWARNRLAGQPGKTRQLPAAVDGSIGSGLGLLAGVTGIGGGIFLSPILHLVGWDKPKVIAAAASMFIFCQSAAGLAGQLTRNPKIDWPFVLPLLGAVWLGGQIGARTSAGRLAQATVLGLTAVLIFYAGLSILWRHW